MTEDEAKTKWCPFVRMVTGKISEGRTEHANGQPTPNRIVDGDLYAWPKAAGCIGSACMAWRWNGEASERRWTMKDAASPGSEWEKAATEKHLNHQLWMRPNPIRPGYCGLAGLPQA